VLDRFTTQALPRRRVEARCPDLWASLLLVVAVVSTPVASVNRMLGKWPPESLGAPGR
jgi:hypothetical protein